MAEAYDLRGERCGRGLAQLRGSSGTKRGDLVTKTQMEGFKSG
jgi:hypothetical protein